MAEAQLNPELYGVEAELKDARGRSYKINNSNIVAYNPFLSLKYDAQYVYKIKFLLFIYAYYSINVEPVSGDGCVKYITYYLMKGSTKALTRMDNFGHQYNENDRGGPNVEWRYDEFQQMRLVRFITSFEAFLSLWGQPLVQRSHIVIIFSKIYIV
jgi:hypothetical protein